MFKNVYTRVAISAAIATLISPSITNALTVPEMSPGDAIRNEVSLYGVAGATTAFVFVLLSMASA